MNDTTTNLTPDSAPRRAVLLSSASRLAARRKLALLLCVVAACSACGVSTALACGWMGTSRSVRFNAWQNEREMQRLPPIGGSVNEPDDSDFDQTGYEVARAEGEARARHIEAAWSRAAEREASRDFDRTRAALSEFLKLTADPSDLGWREDTRERAPIQARRNPALDRLDALASGAAHDATANYLTARAAYDASILAVEREAAAARINLNSLPATTDRAGHLFDSIEAALTADGVCALDAAARHPSLADNCLYLRAAVHYQAGDYTVAADLFGELPRDHPRSEKRNAAIYMAGLASLKASRSYNGLSAVGSEPCHDCTDAYWTRARTHFTSLLRADSRNPFAADARGWLGYLSLRVGRTAEGLAEYYRLLASATRDEERARILTSLAMSRPGTLAADMEAVERILSDEPEAALAYLYHELHNYTFTRSLDVPDEDEPAYVTAASDSAWQQMEHGRSANTRRRMSERSQLRRIVLFADRLMRRHPSRDINNRVALRLAEINLELDQPARAASLAARALRSGAGGDARAEALWLAAVAAQRQQAFADARREMTRLIAEFPRHRLTEGARRGLAIAAEDDGDLGAALDQYFALGYEEDTAYFLDVLMTSAQLAEYIDTRPKHERIDELWYALGVRHLRNGAWNQARAAYSRVRTIRHPDLTEHVYFGVDDDGTSLAPGAKDPDYDYDETGVRSAWLLRDLKTIDDLERLEAAVAAATTREAKAESLYQLASYYYEADSLLLYNTAAWRGSRQSTLGYAHTDASYRQPNEARLLSEHLRDHSTRARALIIYLRIAREFADTPAAPDALYTAAVCYERLQHGYSWGDLHNADLFEGERVITYADVRRRYPRYQLPRGTFGWQPAARTVNGGHGFAPPPPRPRRLTRTEITERRIAIVLDYLQNHVSARAVEMWRKHFRPPLTTLWRWLLIGVTLLALTSVWRAAAGSRRMWRERTRANQTNAEPTRTEEAGHPIERTRLARLTVSAKNRADVMRRSNKFVRRALRASGGESRELRDDVWRRIAATSRFATRRTRRALPALTAHLARTLDDRHARRLLALGALTHLALAVLLVELFRLLVLKD